MSKNSFFLNLVVSVVTGAVVGLIVLCGQYLIQPGIAERILKREKLWQTKFDSYLEAVNFTSDIYQKIDWGKQTFSGLNEEEKKRFNLILSKLYIVTADKKIPNAFNKIISSTGIRTDYYAELINIVRHDLGYPKIHFTKRDYLFLSQHKVGNK